MSQLNWIVSLPVAVVTVGALVGCKGGSGGGDPFADCATLDECDLDCPDGAIQVRRDRRFFHGRFVTYWSNGHKHLERTYVDDKIEGTTSEYRNDGAKHQDCEYERDTVKKCCMFGKGGEPNCTDFTSR